MRIGVLSDTHRNMEAAAQVIERLGACDLWLHAGDFYRDALELHRLYGIPLVAVVGNCDQVTGPEEELLELEGVSVLLTHGHLYRVKFGYGQIVARAQKVGAKLVVFGHTHQPEDVVIEGVRLFNPGSLSRTRNPAGLCAGVITIGGGDINTAFYRPEYL